MSRMALDVQRGVDAIRGVDELEPEPLPEQQKKTRSRGRKQKETTMAKTERKRSKKAASKTNGEAKPRRARKAKAEAEPKAEKAANPSAGLHAKPKDKMMVVNTDGARAVIYKALTAAMKSQAVELTEAETFDAKRLVARLEARM